MRIIPALTALIGLGMAESPMGAQSARSTSGAPVWSVSAAPTLEIGDESDVRTQFNSVNGVLRLPGGEIVVANSHSQELRIFSPTGVFIRSLGRSGGGPGEFRTLAMVSKQADTIFAYDFQMGGQAHVNVFTTGGFKSRVTLLATEAPQGVVPTGRLPSGQFIVSEGGFRVIPHLPAGSIWTDTTRLGVLTKESVRWIGRFPAHQILMFNDTPGGLGKGEVRPGGRASPTTYSVGRNLGQAVSADRFWVGDSETGDVSQFGSSGEKLLSLKLPIQERPFNKAKISRVRESAPAAATTRFQRAGLEAVYSAPLPKVAPLFTRFVSGIDGEVWVELYDEDPDAPRSYLVMSKAGKAIGHVTIPARVKLHEPGRDYVLGVRTDGDGVEQIVQFGLKRPGT